MKKEGFNYYRSEYLPVIKLLADLGFGTLDVDSKGKIRGVKNIKVTLQSIGAAACKQNTFIKGFSPRNKFTTVSPIRNEPQAVKAMPTAVSLEFNINGKILHIPVPKDLTGEEIAQIVKKLA
jgi:hypothetical protein